MPVGDPVQAETEAPRPRRAEDTPTCGQTRNAGLEYLGGWPWLNTVRDVASVKIGDDSFLSAARNSISGESMSTFRISMLMRAARPMMDVVDREE